MACAAGAAESAPTPGDPAKEGQPLCPVLDSPASLRRTQAAASFLGSVHRMPGLPLPCRLRVLPASLSLPQGSACSRWAHAGQLQFFPSGLQGCFGIKAETHLTVFLADQCRISSDSCFPIGLRHPPTSTSVRSDGDLRAGKTSRALSLGTR